MAIKQQISLKKIDSYLYSALLFDNKIDFQNNLEMINLAAQREVIFGGKSSNLMKQNGAIEIGTKVKFYYEQKNQLGTVVSLAGMPYLEIKPDDKPKYRYSVHKRFVKSEELSTQKNADMVITKISEGRYQHYEAGILKNNDRMHPTSIDSLQDVANKGTYIIILKTENHS